MKSKLTPSQIATCERWLRNGRMKTKRLRKKFWSNPTRYIKLGSFNAMFNWYYPKELLEEMIPKQSFMLSKVDKNENYFRESYYQPVMFGTISDIIYGVDE